VKSGSAAVRRTCSVVALMPRQANHSPDRIATDPPPVRITGHALAEAARLLAYLLPYRVKFLAALLALLFSSLLGLAFPYIAGKLVDAAVPVQEGVPLDFWQGSINGIALALLLTLALQALLSFFHSVTLAEVGQRSLADLRSDTYARLIRLPMAFFAQRRVGELSSRLSADLAQIEGTLIGTVPQFLRQLVTLIGGMMLIAITSARLTLFMLCSVPPLIGVAVGLGRHIRRVSKEAQDTLAETNVVVEETLQGIANVKAFTNEGYEQQRYQDGLRVFLGAVLRGARYRGLFGSFITLALFGAIVLVLWYGAGMVQDGQLSVGELTRFMLYTMFVGGAMGSFAELYSQIQRALGASQRVRELLQEQPEELEDPLHATAPSSDGVAYSRLYGDVVFEQVAFSYPSRKEVPVLRDISLAAKAGEKIALVGPSGAGKSTIVSVLLRFYEPERGRILIDGRDAREYTRNELRRQMAIVPQDVLLFGGSIADNIAYGKPGATEEEIRAAARKANADDFIQGFPEGYQTRVGERGIQLSGGQRQRVAIARAILKDPAILVLDEATSSLDSESERLVQQALERLMQRRTSIIIAHRLSTVRTADRIFVVKDGEVVEAGTHAELLAKEEGIYRTLSDLQLGLT
jgi:ABC transporter fused permease/ATP-binding protein